MRVLGWHRTQGTVGGNQRAPGGVGNAYLEGVGTCRKAHAARLVWHAALSILRGRADARLHETLAAHRALLADVVGFLLALGGESEATLAARARGA